MTKNTQLYLISSLLLAQPTLTLAEDLWTPEIQQQLIAGSWCPPANDANSVLDGGTSPLCFLWTAFHTNSPDVVAFARQGEDTTIPNGTLVLIAENDADLTLDNRDWTLAMNIRQFVPAFVHEDAAIEGLSMEEFEALIVEGNTPNHLNCCVHAGDVNLASHALLYGQKFGVDPEEFKARMVDQSSPLASYDALGDYLGRAGGDGGLVALGLRGIGAQAPIRPLRIDGIKLGEPDYPLQVNTKVYVRTNNLDAQNALREMVQREDRWIANDRQYLDGVVWKD